jgi:tRNA G18 (ribose-2'-O)-methylase SpoU
MEPKSYLVLHNVAKNHNVGMLLRSAAAFNVSEVIVVGSRKLPTFGSQGTAKRHIYRQLGSLAELRAYLGEQGVRLCGVEIMPSACSIWEKHFQGSTAFLLGNEGTGLSQAEKEICDEFVFIPQYQSNTESLNVAVAGSIVFHHYAHSIGFPPSPFQDEKFLLTRSARDIQEAQSEAVRQERLTKRQEETEFY